MKPRSLFRPGLARAVAAGACDRRRRSAGVPPRAGRRRVLATLGLVGPVLVAGLLAARPRTAAAAAPTPADWARFADAAYEAAREAVRAWQAQAVLRGVVITGSTATGGRITGPSLKAPMQSAMRARGVPDDIAGRFATAVAEAWAAWHEGVRVPGLAWYPAFASFPGAQAMPTPNVPTPLAALAGAQAGQLAPGALKARIVAHLGPHAPQAGAAGAAEQFAQRFGARFGAWAATLIVRNVIGSGPVPSFRLPLVPAGPVVGGKIVETPGTFVQPPF